MTARRTPGGPSPIVPDRPAEPAAQPSGRYRLTGRVAFPYRGDEWRDRLEIYGLDLRHTPSVEAFCTQLLQTHDRLDFIVNNACQTVRRPAAFYRHMLEAERSVEMPNAARS